MATSINVDGVAYVYTNTGNAGALEQLGITANGAQIRFEQFTADVPTDEFGGDAGPPADVQYFGQLARITLELTKYDPDVANSIRAGVYGVDAGNTGAAGSLLVAGNFTYRMLINTATRPYNFPIVAIRDPQEVNKGTKYSTLRMECTAYASSNVLYNASTS